MTRDEWELIVDALVSAWDFVSDDTTGLASHGVVSAMGKIAAALERDNARFDKHRFMDAFWVRVSEMQVS